MAITLFGSVAVPTDNGTNTANPTAFANPPIASMQTGDLVIVHAFCRTASATIAVSNSGGQSWTSLGSLNSAGGTLTGNLFWCIFNGTWSAAPSFSFGATTNNNVVMLVFRPSSSTHRWLLDPVIGAGITNMAAAATQTQSFSSQTPIGDSSVSVAFFSTDDDNTWGTLTGSGWSKTSLSAQYRNTSGNDTSSTFAYNIKTSKGSIADVSQTETALGNDGGVQGYATFVEYDSAWNSNFVARNIEQPYYHKPGITSNGLKNIHSIISGHLFTQPFPVEIIKEDKWWRPAEQPYFGKFLSIPYGQRVSKFYIPSAQRLKRSLTLYQPASDLTNFAVLFTGTFSYLKTLANGGKVANANGYDIIFYSDSNLTTKLDFERVYWNGTTGQVEFWIRIPTLTSASATVIYISYGNPTITTDQQNATAVWDSNYKAVWHLANATPTTVNPNDSTSNANHCDINNVSVGLGKIIGGVTNIQPTSRLSSNGASLKLTGNKVTVSGWFKPTNNTGNGVFERLLVHEVDDGVNLQDPYIAYGIYRELGTSSLLMGISTGGAGTRTDALLTNVFSAGTWVYCVGTYDGANIVAYKNDGSSNASAAKTGNIVSSAEQVSLGNSYLFTSGAWFDGTYDELRVSDIVRSTTWIATEYSNQNDPDNFYIIGSETNA